MCNTMLKSVGDGRSETYPNLEKIQDNPNLIFFQAEMNVGKVRFFTGHAYVHQGGNFSNISRNCGNSFQVVHYL